MWPDVIYIPTELPAAAQTSICEGGKTARGTEVRGSGSPGGGGSATIRVTLTTTSTKTAAFKYTLFFQNIQELGAKQILVGDLLKSLYFMTF